MKENISKDDSSKGYYVVENDFIPLSDGTVLSARFWFPNEASPEHRVPAILEFLPYRKRDTTCLRDDVNYPYFALNGFVGVRVDMRGCGDSTGFFEDEYTPQEQKDGVEVIEWISKQPWCTGKVGMQGISWGGFNALQIAYEQPPALKAIICIGFTDDRYADDVHFKGGAMLMDNLRWGATMEYKMTLPPDPEFSPNWKEMWVKRLKDPISFVDIWMSHPTRDSLWKHGSVCEDFSRIKAATYLVGGQADGYTNAVMRSFHGLSCPKKAIIGPWVHLYPHMAEPGPRWGFLRDSVNWYNKWLKDEGDDYKPEHLMYIQDTVKAPCPDDINGRWIRDPTSRPDTYFLKNHKLTKEDGHGLVHFSTDEDCGVAWGTFFPTATTHITLEQTQDDMLSYNFETDPFTHDFDICGQPELTVYMAADKPIANLYVRLNHVDQENNSRQFGYSAINMNHDESHERVTPPIPGEFKEYKIALDYAGEKLRKGCKLRLCLSTAYWPAFLPNPEKTTLTIDLTKSSFTLPVLDTYEDLQPHEVLPPDEISPPLFDISEPLTRDLNVYTSKQGETIYHLKTTDDKKQFHNHGLLTHTRCERIESIKPDDPESVTLYMRYDGEWSRDEHWKTDIMYEVKFTADKENMYTHERRTIKYNSEVLLDKTYDRKFQRNGI